MSARSTSERIEVERAIAAEPAKIFAVLGDPQGHVAIDSSGMLMAASGRPVGAVGDRSPWPWTARHSTTTRSACTT